MGSVGVSRNTGWWADAESKTPAAVELDGHGIFWLYGFIYIYALLIQKKLNGDCNIYNGRYYKL